MSKLPSRAHSRSVSSVKAADDDDDYRHHHGGYGSEEAMELAAAHRSVSAGAGNAARPGFAAASSADDARHHHGAPSSANDAVMRESDKVLDFLFSHYARPAHSANGSLSYALLLQLGRDTAMLDRLPHREAAGLMASVKPRAGQERIRAADFRLIVHLVATTSAVSESPDEAYHHLCARMLKNYVGKFPHKLPPNLTIPRDTDARPTTVTHTAGVIAAAERPTTPRRRSSGSSVQTAQTAEAASFATSRRGSAATATNLSARSTTSAQSRAIPSKQGPHAVASHQRSASSRLGSQPGGASSATSAASAASSTWRRPVSSTERQPPARVALASQSQRAEASGHSSGVPRKKEPSPRKICARPSAAQDEAHTDTDDPVVASVLAQHEAVRVTRDAEPLSERIVGDLEAIGYRPRGLGAAADQCRAYLDTGAEAVTLCNMLGIPPTLAPLFDADSITTDGEFWGSIRRCARIVFPEAGCQVVAEELAFQRIFEGAMALEGCGDETSYMSA